MSVELYSSIDELIRGEEEAGRHPADYCFDEAWLIWLDEKFGLQNFAPKGYRSEYIALAEMLKTPEYSASTVDDYHVRIACAAIEIGMRLKKCKSERAIMRLDKKLSEGPNSKSRKYAADSGPVQNEIYAKLLELNDDIQSDELKNVSHEGYSADMMSNFFYVLKMAIAFVEPVLLGKTYADIKPNTEFNGIGNQYGIEKECFHRVFPLYEVALKARGKELGPLFPALLRLQAQLGEFAKCSSQIGNYGYILNELGNDKDLNRRKGNARKRLRCSNGFVVNDQFALYAEWIEGHKSAGVNQIRQWKKGMVLEGVWDFFLDASEQYQIIFYARDPLTRIVAFASYLEMINAAIKKRSKQIMKAIREPGESESAQAK